MNDKKVALPQIFSKALESLHESDSKEPLFKPIKPIDEHEWSDSDVCSVDISPTGYTITIAAGSNGVIDLSDEDLAVILAGMVKRSKLTPEEIEKAVKAGGFLGI